MNKTLLIILGLSLTLAVIIGIVFGFYMNNKTINEVKNQNKQLQEQADELINSIPTPESISFNTTTNNITVIKNTSTGLVAIDYNTAYWQQRARLSNLSESINTFSEYWKAYCKKYGCSGGNSIVPSVTPTY